MRYQFSWIVGHIDRILGFVTMAFGLYGLATSAHGMPFLPDEIRSTVESIQLSISALVIYMGMSWVVRAESLLVSFSIERNTAAILDELRNIKLQMLSQPQPPYPQQPVIDKPAMSEVAATRAPFEPFKRTY